MALEEKRALDEILIRCNSATNNGADGMSIKYREWVEKDGVEIDGTSRLTEPTDAELTSPEVAQRIGELPGVLQAKVDELTGELAKSSEDLAAAQAEIVALQERISDDAA